VADDAMLMAAFGFSDEDLQANRAGELTDAQRERVTAVYQQYRRGIMPTLGIIGAIMVSAVVVSLVRDFLSLDGLSPDELARGLPVCLPLVSVVVVIAGVRSYWLTTGVRRGRIQVAEGVTRLKTGLYRGHTPYYHAKIGGHTFYLANATEFGGFKEGERYRVYYVRYWPDVILSGERVE
jgi:hypothetical protein